MLTVKDLAERLGRGKQRCYSDDEYATLCPAHDDHRPSLVLTQGSERILLFCRAGCSQSRILEELRSKYNILARDIGRPVRKDFRCDVPKPRIRAPSPERRKKRSSLPEGAVFAGAGHRRPPPAFLLKGNQGLWPWHDRSGHVVFYTVRFPDPDGGKMVLPITPWLVGSRIWWEKQAPPDPHFLYDLHLDDGCGPVLAVEGEKTCEAAKRFFDRPSTLFGGTRPWLTTALGGSRKAYMSDMSPLAGRDLYVLQDMDAAGLTYAAQFLPSPARSVILIRLPRTALPNGQHRKSGEIELGYDIEDFADEGWTLADLERMAAQKYLLFRLR